MSVPTHDLAVVAKGLSRLTSCYQNLPKVGGLTSALLASVQELEDVAWTILNGVNLNPVTPPTGQLLDNIAALVNLTRQGMTDAQLWAKFKRELLVLRSRGRSEDILKVANAIAQSTIQEEGLRNGTFLLTAYSIDTTGFASFQDAIARAKDGGARCVLVYTTNWTRGQTLIFSSSRGGNAGLNVLSSLRGGVSGGLLAASTIITGT